MVIDGARRPAHLDRFDPFEISQPEMEPRIARRLIAAAAHALGHTPAPATGDRDACAHAVTIRLGPSRLNLMKWPDFSVRLCR